MPRKAVAKLGEQKVAEIPKYRLLQDEARTKFQKLVGNDVEKLYTMGWGLMIYGCSDAQAKVFQSMLARVAPEQRESTNTQVEPNNKPQTPVIINFGSNLERHAGVSVHKSGTTVDITPEKEAATG
jgi:hypothetical protein